MVIRLKGWRTIAFNTFASVIPFLQLGEVAAIIPSAYMPYYALGLVLANILLRKATTTPMGQDV